jgi:hypothetical protein
MPTLPKQVQDQIAHGNQLAAEMGIVPGQPAQPAPVTAPVTEPAANQNEPAQNEPAQQTQQGQDNWEQKYKILQGKYNAEVPRLAAEVREQHDALRQMQEQMQALASAPQTEVQFSGVGEIDPAHREEYGDEFFQIVAQTAMRSVQPALNQIAQQLEEMRRGLIGTQASVQKTEHQIFLEQLDTQFNSWRTLNKDEGFNRWLGERDALSGLTRKHLLDDAVRSRDVSRAVAFFQGYSTEHGSGAAGSQAPRRETSLESLAAPGATRTGTPPAPVAHADEIWTGAEIRAFYADVRAGKFTGRDAEKLAIEQRIATAAARGRVQG